MPEHAPYCLFQPHPLNKGAWPIVLESANQFEMAYTSYEFSIELSSVIRGHHIYKSVWSPSIGETLPLQIDAESEHDTYAVGIAKDCRGWPCS